MAGTAQTLTPFAVWKEMNSASMPRGSCQRGRLARLFWLPQTERLLHDGSMQPSFTSGTSDRLLSGVQRARACRPICCCVLELAPFFRGIPATSDIYSWPFLWRSQDDVSELPADIAFSQIPPGLCANGWCQRTIFYGRGVQSSSVLARSTRGTSLDFCGK